MIPPFFYRTPFSFYPYNRYSRFSYGDKVFRYNYQNRDQKEPFTENKENGSSSVHNSKNVNQSFDDILIIAIIFFLYNEGVQDQSLFIALILLLLS